MLKRFKKSRRVRFISILVLLIVILFFYGPSMWEGINNLGLFSIGNDSIEVSSNVTDEENDIELEGNKEAIIEIDGKKIILNDEEMLNIQQLIEKLNELNPKDKQVTLRSKTAKQLTFNEVKFELEENDYIVIIEE